MSRQEDRIRYFASMGYVAHRDYPENWVLMVHSDYPSVALDAEGTLWNPSILERKSEGFETTLQSGSLRESEARN